MADLGKRFLEDYVPVHCKASTREEYRRSVTLFIDPAIGEMRISEVQRKDIAELHHGLRDIRRRGGDHPIADVDGLPPKGILTLRWDHVDLDAAEIHLADGKTGARTVHLSPSAVRVLKTLPSKPGSPWVIPGNKPGRHMTDIDSAWESIRAQAGLRDVRIHDIRHSFASRALALGEGLPIIGRLLGHRRVETTARYAHLARDSIRESAERIAVSIAADIL